MTLYDLCGFELEQAMAAAVAPPNIIPSMDWDSPDKATSFQKFRRKCEHLFKSYYKSVEEEERVTYILLWIGDEGDDIFRTFTWENESDSRCPVRVLDKFQTHFEPVTTHRLYRYQLMNTRQGNLPVDSYIKELKCLALKCKFRDNSDMEDHMLDQLIWGCSSNEVQKLLIGKNENLTLSEAVTLVRNYEATRQHMQSLNSMAPNGNPSVHEVSQRGKRGRWRSGHNNSKYQHQSTPPRGRSQTHNDQSQRGDGTRQRDPSQERDHRQSPERDHRQSQERDHRQSQERDHRQYSQYDDRWSNNDRRKRRGRGRGRGRRYSSWSRNPNSRFHTVDEQQDPNNLPADEPYYDTQEDCQPYYEMEEDFPRLSLNSVGLLSVDSTRKDSREQVYAHIDFWNLTQKVRYDLKCKVDTGAEGNIMPVSYYRQMYPENLNVDGYPKPGILKSSDITLSVYGGTTVKNLGIAEIPCSYKSTKFTGVFYVTDVPGPVLMGLKTSLALKLVTVHCAVEMRKIAPHDAPHDAPDTTDYVHPDTPFEDRPRIRPGDIEQMKRMYPECYGGTGDFNVTRKLYTSDEVAPKIHAPRRLPIEKSDQVRKQLDAMEADGIIIRVQGPTDWVSSMLVREKSNGQLRICLDPSDLNKALKREHHPPRSVEDVNHKFSGAKYFTKLDAKNGYWNVKLDTQSSYLTTFNTPFGRYRYLRLPFGLRVSQDIFQQLMDDAYQGCRGAVNIADDIVAYGVSDREHDTNLHETMERTRQNGIKLNDTPEKCDVKKDHVKFYGNIYSTGGIKPDPEKVAAIHKLKAPENKTDLHTFLGIINYMRSFMPHLADHTAPLRELLREDVQFQWSESHDMVFNMVKSLISENTILSYYDRSKPVTLQVDASSRGLGAVLLQDGKPIAFASKALSPAETRYANIERELLAVVYGCEKFHTYLYGRQFLVESDHKPLEQIQKKNLTQAPPRLQRMLLRLQPYDFVLKYQPGKNVPVADALSRLSPMNDDQEITGMEVRIHDVQVITAPTLTALKQETEKDEVLQLLTQQIVKGWPSSIKQLTTALRPFWSTRDDIAVHDGLIMMGVRVIIPESLRSQALGQLHLGHMGMEKSKLRAKASIYWPGIYKDIERTVASCDQCQKHQHAQAREPMIASECPPRPWHTLGSDLFYLNQSWYLLISDYYSKFPFIRKLYSLSARTVVAAFKTVLEEQGIPVKLVCDNGKQFDSYEFRKFAAEYGFEIITSSPYYPRGHGLIERHVQTVKTVMSKCQQDGSDLSMALLILRTTPLDQKLPSPAELLNNRIYKANLPVRIPPPLSHESTQERFAERHQSSADYYNQHTRPLPELLPGQHIQVQDPHTKTWSPATVVKSADTPRSYVIEREYGGTLRRNRQHLRASSQSQMRSAEAPAASRNVPSAAESGHPPVSPTHRTTAPPTPVRPPDCTSRREAPVATQIPRQSGRIIRKPDRLDL